MPAQTTTYPIEDTRSSPDSAELSPCGSSTQVSLRPRPSDPDTVWQLRLGATFSQLSEQFRDASQTLSNISPAPTEDTTVTSLSERLRHIEEGQRKLEADIRELKEQFSASRKLPEKETEDVLKEHIETYQLDQERLPGRLQNALATKSLSPIKMLPMKNRKIPPNAPTTRGEFEHLTKERYEGLLTSYGVPISGDTSAKRESLRSFLGISALPLERK